MRPPSSSPATSTRQAPAQHRPPRWRQATPPTTSSSSATLPHPSPTPSTLPPVERPLARRIRTRRRSPPSSTTFGTSGRRRWGRSPTASPLRGSRASRSARTRSLPPSATRPKRPWRPPARCGAQCTRPGRRRSSARRPGPRPRRPRPRTRGRGSCRPWRGTATRTGPTRRSAGDPPLTCAPGECGGARTVSRGGRLCGRSGPSPPWVLPCSLRLIFLYIL
mmetsp:Transcript_38288/g.95876  ORF Transcript_38288/g.95876 Transcript_38288/m.95876 type:complete len:221 (+) Transcript_38288:303-965(+)